MSRRPDLSLHSRPWRPTYQPSVGPLSTFDDALTRSRTGWVAQARSSRRWAVAGALIGARFAGKVNPETLRKGFGWFVMAMAIFFLAKQLF